MSDPLPKPEPHGLSHLDPSGRASMVDVSQKPATVRVARARALVRLDAATRDLVVAGRLPKGEVLAVAKIAGIQAAKDTARLIPLCHPLALTHVGVEFAPLGSDGLEVVSEARTTGPTGVEMEAMVAASVAGLCVYDMVKARCRDARLEDVRLLHKSGGKSGEWNAPAMGSVPHDEARGGDRRRDRGGGPGTAAGAGGAALPGALAAAAGLAAIGRTHAVVPGRSGAGAGPGPRQLPWRRRGVVRRRQRGRARAGAAGGRGRRPGGRQQLGVPPRPGGSAGRARGQCRSPGGPSRPDRQSELLDDPRVARTRPLHRQAGLRAVVVSTYQAASGAGQQAVHELRAAFGAWLANEPPVPPQALPQTLAANVFPQVDVFEADGYTREEDKLLHELRRILDLPALRVEATCVRVPVERCHSEAISADFERQLSVDGALRVLREAPGLHLVEASANPPYPMPRDWTGRDEVAVGRVRAGRVFGNGVSFWLCGDQLRKGRR